MENQKPASQEEGGPKPEDLLIGNLRVSEMSPMDEDELLNPENTGKESVGETLGENLPKVKLTRNQLRKLRIEEAAKRGEKIIPRKERKQAWLEKHGDKFKLSAKAGSSGSQEGNERTSGSADQDVPKITPKTSGVKRPRSQVTPEDKEEQKKRKGQDGAATATAGTAETFAERVLVVKMAVVREDHPQNRLTEEEALKIKRELGRRAMKGKNVRMTSCHLEAGAIVVGCANSITKEWLENQIQELNPYQGLQLKTGPARSLVKTVTVSTFVPKTNEAENKEEVMEALKNQNELQTEYWSTVGGNSNPNGQSLVFRIDEESLQKLKALNMRPFVGSERLTFKLQGEKNK